MGITKTSIFTESQNELARFAKVLGHPARIAIVQHIVKRGECICGDLVQEIGLAQATISQHLRELKQANIIQGTIEGTSVCYCLNPKTCKKLMKVFSGLFDNIKRTCC